MTTLSDIAVQLKEPFSMDCIDFLPKGKVERDGKTLCMALPYADPRVYQDRLNAIAYGEWSTPAPVVVAAGNKLICYVTVILCGVAHTDVGEATNNEENTGTEAWAQAFKRACSHFGLGRYLYDLDKEWVPFNVQRKAIDLDSAGKKAIVRKMYQKAGIAIPGTVEQPAPAMATSASPQPAQARQEPAQGTEQAANIKAKIDTLIAEFATLFPKMAKKPDWQTLLAQRVWGEVPEAYTLDHYRTLNAYYLKQKSAGKSARVQAM